MVYNVRIMKKAEQDLAETETGKMSLVDAVLID